MSRLSEIEVRLKAATGGEWTLTEQYVDERSGQFHEAMIWSRSAHLATIRVGLESSDGNACFLAHCGGDSGDVAWLLERDKQKDELIKTLAAGVQEADEALLYLSIDGPVLSANSQEQVIKAARSKLIQALRAAEEAGV